MSSRSILYTEKDISSPSIQVVKIHPLVMFYMIDAHERAFYQLSTKPSNSGQGWSKADTDKTDGQKSVEHAVGLLYGQYSDRDCNILDSVACLPHLEVQIDPAFKNSMHSRHVAMFPKEELVGYFSVSEDMIPWPRQFFSNKCSLYVWMRPSAPTKVNVFYMESSGDELVPLPVEYVVEASAEEQMGLSLLAGEHRSKQSSSVETGSLQAAGHELVSLLKKFSTVCRGDSVLAKNTLIGRKIFVAVKQAKLEEAANGVLGDSQKAIDTFLAALKESDQVVAASEQVMTLDLH